MTDRKLTTKELESYLLKATVLVDQYPDMQPLLDRFEELYDASKKPPLR